MVRDELKKHYPELQVFSTHFCKLKYTLNSDNHLLRYVLESLHRAQDLSIPHEGIESMNIEHLIPRSAIGEGVSFVDSLGNLILVDRETNTAKLKNLPFEQRQKILRKLRYGVPHEVIHAQQWTEKEIKERTMHLAKLAYTKVWNF